MWYQQSWCAALTVTGCTLQNWVTSTWLRIPTSHNPNRAVRNIALLHNTPLRGALGLIMSRPSMFLFGSAILHANNPLKNVSTEFVLLCKKAQPLHFIQSAPQLVLSAVIGNFANKVACFSRIVSHPIAKSRIKPWSVREYDATRVRLFLPFVFKQLRLI